jgi:hypothetical protein
MHAQSNPEDSIARPYRTDPSQVQEYTMEKSGSFSQITRINKGHTVAAKADRTNFSAEMHQQVAVDDARYHTEKLGLGEHGAHEGWIKAEEASAASNTAINPETHHEMIAVAAYHLAEERGFAGHGAEEDWFKAEAAIDATLHGQI